MIAELWAGLWAKRVVQPSWREEAELTRRLQADLLSYAANPIYIMPKGETLRFEPGAVWEMGDMTGVSATLMGRSKRKPPRRDCPYCGAPWEAECSYCRGINE